MKGDSIIRKNISNQMQNPIYPLDLNHYQQSFHSQISIVNFVVK